VVAKPGI